jgi:hypothetical protein
MGMVVKQKDLDNRSATFWALVLCGMESSSKLALARRLGITAPTIRTRLKTGNWSKLEKEKIEQILEEYGLDEA